MARLLDSLRNGRGMTIALLVVPLGYLILVLGLPLIYNIVMSFQRVDVFGLARFNHPFVGFENYISVFSRPETGLVIRNTAIFLFASIGAQFVIGFSLALLFAQKFPGASYIRGLFLASWVLPGLVIGAIWNWMLAGDFGVLNYALRSLNIISEPIFWRSNPSFALWSVIIANIWWGIAFNMTMLSVGLTGIPQELYEAAKVDGAGPIRRFFSITLPMMQATIGAILSLGIIFTLQQFDLFAAITGGGPSNSSNVAQYWAWEMSFQQLEFSKGATVSVVMLVVVVIAALIYVSSTRHEVRE
jgi:multiple sugar transport system permease protein